MDGSKGVRRCARASEEFVFEAVGFASGSARWRLFFESFALDALRDGRPRGQRSSVSSVTVRARTSHHADESVFDEQRITGEGDHAGAPRPFLVADARVVRDIVGEMRPALLCDEADFELADGHARVRAVEVRVDACAGL